MHFAVDVRARDPMSDDAGRLCTHCVIVYVALDHAGKLVQVPTWVPISEEDTRLSEYATKVMALSKDIEKTVARYRATDAHAS
jgi:acyl-CoA hydrolase